MCILDFKPTFLQRPNQRAMLVSFTDAFVDAEKLRVVRSFTAQ